MDTAVYDAQSAQSFGFNFNYRNSILYLRDVSNEVLEQKKVEFTDMCTKIMRGNLQMNAYQFSCLINTLSNKCPSDVTTCVYNALNSVSKELRDQIARDIENDTFTLNNFSRTYDQYQTNLGNLTTHLKVFLDWLRAYSTNERQHNVIRHYGHMLFYINVINHTYRHNDDNVMFYPYINTLISTKTHGLADLQSILKIHRYYCNLSIALPECAKYFNVSGDEQFMTRLSSSDSFVRELVQFMNEQLKILHQSTSSKSKTAPTISKTELEEYARLVAWFSDPSTFMAYYGLYLSTRLLSPTGTDVEMELRMLQLMSNQGQDDSSYRRMQLMLDDISVSKQIFANLYKKAKISVTTDRFNSIKDVFDPTKAEARYLASDNWSLPESMPLVPPLECDAYMHTFERLYINNLYMDRSKKCVRKLTWNHNLSIGVVNLTLASSKIPYTILAHMPTHYILMCFNEKEQWTPKELAEKLNFPLESIGNYLTLLSNSGLINVVKSAGDTDVHMALELNQKFTSVDHNLIFLSDPTAKQAQTNDGIKSEEIMNVLTETFKFVNAQKEVTYANIVSHLDGLNLTFALTDTHVKTAIARAISEKLIESKNSANGLLYFVPDDSDDEADEVD
jgi:hypothetical protein